MADEKEKAKAIKDSKKKDADKSASLDKQAAAKDDAEKEQDAGPIDPRKFVIVNPDVDDVKVNENQGIWAGRTQTQIDYLIRLGLGDQDHLNYYRQVLKDPRKANNNPMLRKYVSFVLEELLGIVFSDTQMYNRLKLLLQEKLPKTDVDNKEARGGKITEAQDLQTLRKRWGKPR